MDSREVRHEKIMARQLAKWALGERYKYLKSLLWRMRVRQSLARLEKFYHLDKVEIFYEVEV